MYYFLEDLARALLVRREVSSSTTPDSPPAAVSGPASGYAETRNIAATAVSAIYQIPEINIGRSSLRLRRK